MAGRARSALFGADDECLAHGADDLGGDCAEVVDLEDPFGLSEEAMDESEVAVGDPGDGADRLGVGEVVEVEGQAEAVPVVGEHERNSLVLSGW